MSPWHAWKLARRAFSAARRRKKWTAAALGGLALAELVSWLTLRGVGLVVATAAVLALGVAWLAWSAAGGELR